MARLTRCCGVGCIVVVAVLQGGQNCCFIHIVMCTSQLSCIDMTVAAMTHAMAPACDNIYMYINMWWHTSAPVVNGRMAAQPHCSV